MAHTIRISQFQRPVNAQILIRILPVHNKCMFAVWSNNVDARIIAYSIAMAISRSSHSEMPVGHKVCHVLQLSSHSFAASHTIYHVPNIVCIINGESDTVQYNAMLLSASHEMQLKPWGRCGNTHHTHGKWPIVDRVRCDSVPTQKINFALIAQLQHLNVSARHRRCERRKLGR